MQHLTRVGPTAERADLLCSAGAFSASMVDDLQLANTRLLMHRYPRLVGHAALVGDPLELLPEKFVVTLAVWSNLRHTLTR